MFKRALVPILILLVLIGGAVFARNLMASSASKAQIQYRITAAKSDTVKKTVTATGVLTPWKTVDIKSRAGGKVVSMLVDEGNIVKKGQVLARIDPSDTLLTYNSAKADIDSNRAHIDETTKSLDYQKRSTQVSISTSVANLNAAKATRDATKARWDSAQSQSDAQKDLTEASIESAKATLAAEQEKLAQMEQASHPQESALALATLHQAQANRKNAEAQLNRQKALLTKGFVAQSQVDTAQATYDVAVATEESAAEKIKTIDPELQADLKSEKAHVRQLEAALRTAEANRVDIALKRQAAEAAKADYFQSEANVKQAEARLVDAQNQRINDDKAITVITQAKAATARSLASLANAQVQLADTNVAAPSDGIILKKLVEEGTFITSGQSFNSSGTSLLQMGDISRMYVDVQVDETDVANVEMDQKVDITFDAYSTTPFEGKVIKIEPSAVVDQNVTTVHVRVEVDNSQLQYKLLKPGMNATCEFIIKKKDDVLCVPNEAMKTDNDGNRYVEVAIGGKPAPADKDSDPDPNLFVGCKIEKRNVEIDLEGNDSTEITSGIKPDDRVVTQTIEPTTAAPSSGNPFGSSKGPGKK